MKRFVPVFLFAAFLAVPGDAAVRWGARGGFSDGEPIIGADLIMAIGKGFYFNPSVEVGAETLSTNADVHYDIEIQRDAAVWIGGGVTKLLRHHEDLNFGANVIVGLGARRDNRIFYTQAKRTYASGDSFNTFVFGMRF